MRKIVHTIVEKTKKTKTLDQM